MTVADAGCRRHVGKDGDDAHGSDHNRAGCDGCRGVVGRLSVNAGGEQRQCCHDHAFGALHESDLALQPETFGAGAHVAHHDGACQRQKCQQDACEIAQPYQPAGDSSQCEKFAIAVEHGVVHGAESRRHAAQTRHLTVEHVEKREAYDQCASQGHAAVVGGCAKDQAVALCGKYGCGRYVSEKAYGGDNVGGDTHADQ